MRGIRHRLGRAHRQAHAVARRLDGRDGADLLDDSGEHQLSPSSAGWATISRSSPRVCDGCDGQPSRLCDRADAEVAEREPVAADQDGGDVGEHLVDEARAHERARERRAAFDEDALHAAVAELGQHGGEVVAGSAKDGVRDAACTAASAGIARSPSTTGIGWWS